MLERAIQNELPRDQAAARARATPRIASPAPLVRQQGLLIDVSRLIWRVWTGRLPTGIDRVCLAYVEHFGARAQAVVQKGGVRLVLDHADSQALFALIGAGAPHFRRRLVALAPGALARARRPVRGSVYLNIGHTGLESAGLPGWIARHGLRTIYMIHDLIPITNPEFCRPGEAEKHIRRMANVLASASGVIANSHATLADLGAFARASGAPMPPATVAWLAGQPELAPGDAADLGPPARPYFVTVGTIEGRKNHIMLLRLWRRLVERMGDAAPQLRIIGQRGWEADHVLAVLDRCDVLAGHVLELGACDDAALARHLRHARALLMPSFAEGFGLPLIEAIEAGTPVIASDLAVFREIAGDIPQFLAPWDGVGWERAVLDFAGESADRARQIAALPGFSAPDWPGHFAAIEAWLEEL